MVSMHLLVPGAYRPMTSNDSSFTLVSLNAPSGAGCLPTFKQAVCVDAKEESQCTFWCRVLTDIARKSLGV